ncbi:MAG: 3D domain-containing protein, partial [Bdellovibrionota bacterium]
MNKTLKIQSLLFLLLASCGVIQPAQFVFPDSSAKDVLGTFRNTYYYMALESDFPDQAGTHDLIDLKDIVLATVSSRYKKALDMEGTGRLRDGRVVNFAGKLNGVIRYHVTDFPFGHGVGSCELIPFHSIAVDKNRIPLGSVVQIDESIGMHLPDGSKHDGLWRAEDIGGAIQNDHIDLFVGAGNQGHVLVKAGITEKIRLTVRLITPPQADSCVDKNLDGTLPKE